MSLKFVESFDHLATADLTGLGKWNDKVSSGGISPSVSISAGNGRNGTSSLRIVAEGGSTCYLSKVLPASQTWIVGFSYKLNSSLTSVTIFSWWDTTIQLDFRLNSDGTFKFTKSGTLLGSASSFAISSGTTNYIELKVVIDTGTGGSVAAHVNGVEIINSTGLNTRSTANSSANQMRLGSGGTGTQVGGYTADFDDLYFCDAAGSVNNDFLGDKRVIYLPPNGAGTTTEFSRGGADSGSNYGQVDELSPNSDTDYVYDNVVGHKDTYAMTDLVQVTGTISGIQTILGARKDDAGDRTIAAVIRSGGTDYDGANASPSTAYSFLTEIRETDPDTSAAWTIAGINAMEMGPKITT